MTQKEIISAEDILKLLAQKHRKDIFVPQCKTGPTWYCNKGLLILDAWVMKKSWLNPLVIGYELKISRNDFLNDKKWRGYLSFCNEFYFVSLKNIIFPPELPEEAGLMYKAGSRLFTKKKSIYRNIEIPTTIFEYILMNRIKVIR